MNNPQKSPSVGAVVVTWNSSRDIVKCLNSLLSQSHPLSEIIIIDNHSSDNTVELLRAFSSNIKLIENTENAGFARANNQAIAELSTDWIFTLNPDAWVEADFVETLLNFSQDKHNIGTLGGKLLQADSVESGKPLLDSLGIEIFRSRRVRDFAMRQPASTAPTKPFRVFGICAAAALYRREMLNDTMIDDEIFPVSFFSYYEDTDLAWRSWRRGWQAWTVPDAVGFHRRGGSPTGNRFSRTLTHRNLLWMIARNESLWKTLTAMPEIAGHIALMKLRMLRYPYLFKATFEAWAGLSEANSARCKLRSTNPEPPPFKKGVGFS